MTNTKPRSAFWASFGPGILFAGAAIGTSHLVQSTRAGAMFGLGLLGIVIVANILKYPAFRFGPQYAAATGRSLIEGYRDLGRWVVGLYLLSEVGVMAIVLAATGLVTAAILLAVSGIEAEARYAAIVLIVLGVFVLGIGGFKLLDRLTKVFVLILTIATVIATVVSLPRIEWDFAQIVFPFSDVQTFGFVIALMGFMPSALDLSLLQSLWSVAKQKASGVKPSMKHAMTDFNIGYLGSAGLAICFLLMGAGVMHTSGEAPAANSAEFAGQVIALYTTNLGDWAGTVVGVAAVFVMFTTLITILDGFPRLLATGVMAFNSNNSENAVVVDRSPLLYLCIAALVIGATTTLLWLMGNFQSFIDMVTITAFIVGPITALLNHIVIVSNAVPPEHRPSRLMQVWSMVGIVVLSLLAVTYLYMRLTSA
ncbi:MAG: NRAMP family divalent metal transporter [Pseudomonadales bacterium]